MNNKCLVMLLSKVNNYKSKPKFKKQNNEIWIKINQYFIIHKKYNKLTNR